MRLFKFSFGFLPLFLLLACTQAPTVVTESDQSLINRTYEFEKKSRPLKINPETFILDTRSYFDFQVSRLPGAIYLNAQDFSLRGKYGDDLESKSMLIATRLALWGIDRFSHVIVVGYGNKGNGDEGVVALALVTVGVEKVQIGSMEDLRKFVTTKESPVRPNVRYWHPRLAATNCPLIASNEATGANSGAPVVIHIGKKPFEPDQALTGIPVVGWDWKEFLNIRDFSPNQSAKIKLAAQKVTENSRLLVHGSEAPIAVFSLLQLGYVHACLLDQ